ncbi:MAG TPA: hypothetical protein VMT27_00490 [Actinomycetes bacterium]|nr:hypothetical protein [Actinomycetes bacterium]
MSQHHDPVHPDSEHLTAEVLADLGLGLLDQESAEHAASHLEHCQQCTELQADLSVLTDALHNLQAHPTEPMPDAVWRQLEESLATEPVVTPEGSATVVPLQATRKRRFGRPGIGVVAGAAGVALLGAILIPTVLNNSDDAASVDASSSSADRPEATGPVSTSDFAATRSGTKYDEAKLDSQVTELVAARTTQNYDTDSQTSESKAPGAASGTVSASPAPSLSDSSGASDTQEGNGVKGFLARAPMATDPAAAQACLETYLDVPGVAPLAIDIGTWQGKPAAVIVLPLDDPTLAEVWVINPNCSTSDATNPLYYYATISR